MGGFLTPTFPLQTERKSNKKNIAVISQVCFNQEIIFPLFREYTGG